MDAKTFFTSINQPQIPANLSLQLQSLWYDAQGDWEKAHHLIQDEPDRLSARIHGYLHRKEGDAFNAGYWYNRAGCTKPVVSLEEEWEQLVHLAIANR